MDLLQIALIFLILLISIFLAIAGLQVFFILRELHKSLRRLDKILETSQDIAMDIERPVKAASNIVSSGLENSGRVAASVAKAITGAAGKVKNQNRRFYRKIMK